MHFAPLGRCLEIVSTVTYVGFAIEKEWGQRGRGREACMHLDKRDACMWGRRDCVEAKLGNLIKYVILGEMLLFCARHIEQQTG